MRALAEGISGAAPPPVCQSREVSRVMLRVQRQLDAALCDRARDPHAWHNPKFDHPVGALGGVRGGGPGWNRSKQPSWT